MVISKKMISRMDDEERMALQDGRLASIDQAIAQSVITLLRDCRYPPRCRYPRFQEALCTT